MTTLLRRSGSLIAFFTLTLIALSPCIGASLTTDQQQVIRATVTAVHSRFPKARYAPRVTEIAIVGSYALTTWMLGEGGGQAALQKKNDETWSVIGMGGGEMNRSTLVSFGVPSATATRLWNELRPLPRPAL